MLCKTSEKCTLWAGSGLRYQILSTNRRRIYTRHSFSVSLGLLPHNCCSIPQNLPHEGSQNLTGPQTTSGQFLPSLPAPRCPPGAAGGRGEPGGRRGPPAPPARLSPAAVGAGREKLPRPLRGETPSPSPPQGGHGSGRHHAPTLQ